MGFALGAYEIKAAVTASVEVLPIGSANRPIGRISGSLAAATARTLTYFDTSAKLLNASHSALLYVSQQFECLPSVSEATESLAQSPKPSLPAGWYVIGQLAQPSFIAPFVAGDVDSKVDFELPQQLYLVRHGGTNAVVNVFAFDESGAPLYLTDDSEISVQFTVDATGGSIANLNADNLTAPVIRGIPNGCVKLVVDVVSGAVMYNGCGTLDGSANGANGATSASKKPSSPMKPVYAGGTIIWGSQ